MDNLCKADNFTNQLIIQVTKSVVLSIIHYYSKNDDSKMTLMEKDMLNNSLDQ